MLFYDHQRYACEAAYQVLCMKNNNFTGAMKKKQRKENDVAFNIFLLAFFYNFLF